MLLMFLYSQVYQYFITANVELVFITCYYLWLCLNSVDCTDTASKGNTQLIAKHSCLLPLSKLAQWANWQVDEWVQEMFDILQASSLSQPAANNNSNTLIQMKPKWRSGNVSTKCIQAQSEANRHGSKLRCWRFLTPIHTSFYMSWRLLRAQHASDASVMAAGSLIKRFFDMELFHHVKCCLQCSVNHLPCCDKHCCHNSSKVIQ